MSGTYSASHGRYARASAVGDAWDGYRRTIHRRDAGRGRVWLYARLLGQLGDWQGALRMTDDALAKGARGHEAALLTGNRMRAFEQLGSPGEVVEAFSAYAERHPEWYSPAAVSMALKAYQRTDRQMEGTGYLRGLARRHSGSRLAAAILIALRRTVELCSTSETQSDGRLSRRGRDIARRQASWRRLSLYSKVVTDGTVAASETVTCFGLRDHEVDRRLASGALDSEGDRAVNETAAGTFFGPPHPPAQAGSDALQCAEKAEVQAVGSVVADLPDGARALAVLDARRIEELVARVQRQTGLPGARVQRPGPCESVLLTFEGCVVVEVTQPLGEVVTAP
ncbi:MAG: hypothetical protein FJX74_16245 [Armatimonadetes bacterium]|nr:hypothetical protein [Armatimonadota bacterium]